MFEPLTFGWNGWLIHLSGMFDGGGTWVWTAEVQGTDEIFVLGGAPRDDAERVRHLVGGWIDAGFPSGGEATDHHRSLG